MDGQVQRSVEEPLLSREEAAFEHDYTSPVPEYVRAEGSWLFNRYFDFLSKFKAVVVLVWFAIFVVGLSTGFGFMSKSNDAMLPPVGTRAHRDQVAFTALFPDRARELPVLVVIQTRDRSAGIDLGEREDLRNYTATMIAELERYNVDNPGLYLRAMGYYTFDGTPLDSVKSSLISKDRQVTFINIMVNQSYPTGKRGRFMKWFLKLVVDLNPDKHTYDIGTTGKSLVPSALCQSSDELKGCLGLDALAYTLVSSSKEQLEHTDGITIPLALCVLGYMVGSWRFLGLTLYNMVGAVATAMAVMLFLVNHGLTRPDSVCAQLMQGISLGLSIDYSLFLFTRINEEIIAGESTSVAVYRSLMHAGHVIIMSGLTIVVVFLGFVVLREDQIRVDGLGCSIGISFAILVALTNSPAMILLFPRFFSTFNGFCGRCRSNYGVGAPKYQAARERASSSLSLEDVSASEAFMSEIDEKAPVKPIYRTLRFRITCWLTKWPNNLISIILLYLCVIPLAWQVTRININEDILAQIPRGSDAGKYLKVMTKEFSAGSFGPFSVVVSTSDKAGVNSPHFFKFMGQLSERILNETECRANPTSVTSPAFVDGKKMPFYLAGSLLEMAKSSVCSKTVIPEWAEKVCARALQYRFLYQNSVNTPRDNAMIITALVPFFPFAKKSQPFIDKVYSIIDQTLAAHPGEYKIAFAGTEVGNDTVRRLVYSQFPIMIGVTLGSVFLLMGLMMKSAFVPIRLALTLVLPLLAVYGLGILVYQDGMLNWLSPATAAVGGFFWFIPILITSIVCGLALDYDVFLITRIIEHRRGGYDIRASIVKAVCETGTTIASAGVILTLAFAGLMLSDESALDIGGFMLSTAVLFDTFVVNTVLVPALMSLGDRIAWWPMKVEFEGLKTLDDPEFTGSYTHSSDSDGHTDNSTTYDSLPGDA